MVVYVEYAFLENLLFDFTLLCMSSLLCRRKILWWKTLISACVGGVFAVIYPLILLPQILLIFLKISVGFLLCFIAFPRIKSKKDLPMYALNTAIFFFLTFLYGGALIALFSQIFPQKTPIFLVVIGFAALSIFTIMLARAIYRKRQVFRYVYHCEILYKQRKFAVLGYLDSGNLASKNGVPVCFLSPDVFYDVFGLEILGGTEQEKTKRGGQVCDEMEILTMSGRKRVQLFKADVQVKISQNKKIQTQAYFCPSNNMINREYKLLLNANIFNGANC